MLNIMQCKSHPGCIYEVTCDCKSCSLFTINMYISLWQKMAKKILKKNLLTQLINIFNFERMNHDLSKGFYL